MSSPKPHHARLNTLKLDQRDLESLHEKFTEDHPSDGTRADREHTRFEFLKTRVVLEIVHPDGNRVKMPVASRNISRQGIALLHSSYAHINSSCVVCIFSPSLNKWIRVPGTVTRCEHRGGTAHEIGIRFEEEINTRDILNLDPMGGEWCRERVDLNRLRGRLLVCDSDDLVQRLIVGLLKNTEVEVVQATSLEQGLELASGCDLVLCEYYLGESTGPEYTTNLRNSGLMIPVLLMSCDKSEEIRDEMLCAGAAGFLSKPLTAHNLHRALAEFMLDNTAAELAQTALPADDPRVELLEPFVASLKVTAEQLEKAIESNDIESCKVVCRQLASQAPSLGFKELGHVADAAMQSLGTSQCVMESSRELSHLVGLCQLTKVKPPTPVEEPQAEKESTETSSTDKAA